MPEWQRQARTEAIRQGGDPADIELECEKNKSPAAIIPMLNPLRRRGIGHEGGGEAGAGRVLAVLPLAVYFAAVNDGGEEAWRQERTMMGRRLLGMPREHRGDPMSLGAIEIMLPTWRA